MGDGGAGQGGRMGRERGSGCVLLALLWLLALLLLQLLLLLFPAVMMMVMMMMMMTTTTSMKILMAQVWHVRISCEVKTVSAAGATGCWKRLTGVHQVQQISRIGSKGQHLRLAKKPVCKHC